MNRSAFYLYPLSKHRIATGDLLFEKRDFPERYLFFGQEGVRSSECFTSDNLWVNERKYRVVWRVLNRIINKVVGEKGVFNGDWASSLFNIFRIRKADNSICVFDRVSVPFMYLRKLGLLGRKKFSVISMGLTQRIEAAASEKQRRKFISILDQAETIICFSTIEEEKLKKHPEFRDRVYFLPLGVDADYFNTVYRTSKFGKVDVVTIGADAHRDFEKFFRMAEMCSELSFRLITSLGHFYKFREIPENVEVITEIPMSEVRDYLEASEVVILPVKNNDYSGGTTVLVQAMAMGKPVVVSEVKPLSGYELDNFTNVVLMKEGETDQQSVDNLQKLLNDSELCRKIGTEARKTVEEKLSLEIFQSKMDELFGLVEKQL